VNGATSAIVSVVPVGAELPLAGALVLALALAAALLLLLELELLPHPAATSANAVAPTASIRVRRQGADRRASILSLSSLVLVG
jgi:hypothetical protein